MGTSRYVTGTQGRLSARNLSSRIYIEEDGNWGQLIKALDSLPREVRKSAFNAMRSYGELYERRLKRNIRNEGANFDRPWPPLSEKYLIYKKKHDPDYLGMYRWTGTLYNAIHVSSNIKDYTVRVSISPVFAGRKKRELNAAQIALILENGSLSHNVKPRPLFYPTWRELGGNTAMATYVSEKLSKTVNNHLISLK